MASSLRLSSLAFYVYQYIQKHQLIQENDKLILSFSAGADSTALACLLLEIRQKIPFSFLLAHFNHGLREQSKQEAAFTADFAKEHDLAYHIFQTDKLNKSKNLQLEARTWRYTHLKELKQETKANKIALAHHKNDALETLLWRIFRGSSLFTLHPLTAARQDYIRPLLSCKKTELENYLKEKKQIWFEDESNKDNYYTRNKLRNQLIPQVNSILENTSWQNNMLHLSEESELLKETFHFYVPNSLWEKDFLVYKEIQALPSLFARKAIHAFLTFHQWENIRYDIICKLETLIRSNQGNWHIQLAHNAYIAGFRKKVTITYT